MFTNNRDELRQFYYLCWQKRCQNLPLEGLEAQVVAVILDHPEYHALIENKDLIVQKEYLPEMGETNPFLHMGLHLGLREQVATDRPEGMVTLYSQLILKLGEHEAEHAMMECLTEAFWSAQKNQTAPDNLNYLSCIKAILGMTE